MLLKGQTRQYITAIPVLEKYRWEDSWSWLVSHHSPVHKSRPLRDSVSKETRRDALGNLHLKLTSAFHLDVQPHTYVNLYIHKHMHMNIRKKKAKIITPYQP